MKIFLKNWQLQKLGIINWSLKNPNKIIKKINFSLPIYIRLLVIAKNQPVINNPIVKDVLYALNLNLNQILQITPDILDTISKDTFCNSWRIGVIKKIRFNGSHIISPTLDELSINPVAKIELWEQICCNQQSFFIKI